MTAVVLSCLGASEGDLNLVRSHPIVRWDVDDPDAKKASAELD